MNPWLSELFALWVDGGYQVNWIHSQVNWIHSPEEIPNGELCFILNCSKLVKPNILNRNKHNLVIHASDLPKGKGWSPWTWLILEGENDIPLTLFEAKEAVDSGVIYLQEWVIFDGHELIDEIRESLANKIVSMCQHFVQLYPNIIEESREQNGNESFYPRRNASDSQLDIHRSIVEQFNLLRVVDNDRYPAFFEYRGCKYLLKIEKDEIIN